MISCKTRDIQKKEIDMYIENNKSKDKNEYHQRPHVKEFRRAYSKDYMAYKRYKERNEGPFPEFKEWRIQKRIQRRNDLKEAHARDLANKIVEIKSYPLHFPKAKFKRELDVLLSDSPFEVDEKKLKDVLHDILDKEKRLTVVRMIRLYNDRDWEIGIETSMRTKEYVKEGDKYVKLQK
jgi:hypothetical protein